MLPFSFPWKWWIIWEKRIPMEKKFIVENGIKYQVFPCPKCGAELKFKLQKEKRRVYGACLKCGGSFDVEVDKES